jgi:hypothetical protein
LARFFLRAPNAASVAIPSGPSARYTPALRPTRMKKILVISAHFYRASAMDLSDTFRRHAPERQRMASSTRDAADKATGARWRTGG